jgi:hypothetical protein
MFEPLLGIQRGLDYNERPTDHVVLEVRKNQWR